MELAKPSLQPALSTKGPHFLFIPRLYLSHIVSGEKHKTEFFSFPQNIFSIYG